MKLILLLLGIAIAAIYESNAQGRGKTLEEKVNQIKDLTMKKSVINLNLNRFKELVRSPPRDYSFIVMFTAMSPNRQCMICQHVYDEYFIVANSFKYSNQPTDKLYFGIVDFDDSNEIFQMMRLNTAPVIMHFPSKGKPKPSDTMDFERNGLHAEAIAKWIMDRTDIPIKVYRPPNYSGIVLITVLVVIVGLLLYAHRDSMDFLYNKQFWAIGAVFFCLAMISGQMWNQIRGPPFMHRNKNGPVFINGGSHGQFVVESYIVALLNGAVILGMIIMIESIGDVGKRVVNKPESKQRYYMSIAGVVMVIVFFSLLLSVFKGKTQGYPYSLLFK